MPERIPQSTAIRVPLQAYLASDHIAAATGKTIAITISKNGGAYGNPSAGATNATEISAGSYYVDLSTTDTATVGPLFVKGTEAATDTIIAIYNAVAASAEVAAIKVQTDKLTFTVPNQIDANVLDWKSATAPAMTGDAYDALTGAQAEPGQGAPAVNATPIAKISYLYKWARNKLTNDGTTLKMFADDATTVDQKATVADNGTTFTRGEIASGP